MRNCSSSRFVGWTDYTWQVLYSYIGRINEVALHHFSGVPSKSSLWDAEMGVGSVHTRLDYIVVVYGWMQLHPGLRVACGVFVCFSEKWGFGICNLKREQTFRSQHESVYRTSPLPGIFAVLPGRYEQETFLKSRDTSGAVLFSRADCTAGTFSAWSYSAVT